MRLKPSSLVLTGALVAALSGTVAQSGCGGGSGDEARAPETAVHVTAVDVTYYYLPGLNDLREAETRRERARAGLSG